MVNSLKWLGHAGFQITTKNGTVILIDPWITGNPSCPIKKEDIKHADIILITHDHFDHIGTDIPYLVRTTNAIIIAQPEVSNELQQAGVANQNFVFGMGMNIGGQVKVKDIKVVMTQAFHSSTTGSPVGYIIILEDGKTIYHAGDTGIFESMRLFDELYKINIALLPIGGVFAMDPFQAAMSLTLLKPKKVIPIHYKTFPILEQSAAEFIKLSQEKAPNVLIEVLEPGQEILI